MSSGSEELKITPHKSKYKVKLFAISDPELSEDVVLHPTAIESINIIQDFESCFQPIVQICCVLPPMVLDFINTHQETMSFILRLQEIDYLSSNVNTIDDNFNDNGAVDICNGKYIQISADTTKMPNKNAYMAAGEIIDGKREESTKSILVHGSNLQNYTSKVNIFIWKESDLYNLRAQVNGVYNNASIADTCANLLTENGFSRVLMFPPDNTENFSQLIIPPMAMMNVFNFMQERLGVYNSGILFFSDIYRTYIIDKSGECKATEDNEYPKVIFPVVDDNRIESQTTGTAQLDEKKEYHNMVKISSVGSRSLSSVNDILQGNNNRYIDSKNNEITTVSGSGRQRGSGCVNITNDNEGTSYNKSSQANSINELAQNLQITGLRDYSYKAMTPNKTYIFSFTNRDQYSLNGYYRLTVAKHVISRIGQGDEMTILGVMEFTRKKVLSENERQEITYDVFKTAELSDTAVQDSQSKATEINKQDPSYQQSETNQIAEGKRQAPTTSQPTVAPNTTTPSTTTTKQPTDVGAPIPLDER